MQRKITNRIVDGMRRGQTVYDVDVHGFGVRCGTNYKSYHLKYFLNGRQKWLTIGKHGSPWSAEAARKRAIELLHEIARGADPQAQKLRRREMPHVTISQLAERYLVGHAALYKSPRSVRLDGSNLNHHIVPLLGRRQVAELSRQDVVEFQRGVASGKSAGRRAGKGMVVQGGPLVANRCLTLLSKMLNLAEEWGIRSAQSNPVKGIAKFRESSRERYLTTSEFARLGHAIEFATRKSLINPFAAIAFNLLLLTGARLSEIQTLQWEWIDLERRIAKLPNSKTGQKVLRLSEPAVALLRSVPREPHCSHVIAGKGSTHLKNLNGPWTVVRSLAGLPDLRIHDLRHSFASIAAGQGKSLQVIGALLGHSRIETTQRYAHLRPDDLSEAGQEIGAAIASMLSGKVAD